MLKLNQINELIDYYYHTYYQNFIIIDKISSVCREGNQFQFWPLWRTRRCLRPQGEGHVQAPVGPLPRYRADVRYRCSRSFPLGFLRHHRVFLFDGYLHRNRHQREKTDHLSAVSVPFFFWLLAQWKTIEQLNGHFGICGANADLSVD